MTDVYKDALLRICRPVSPVPLAEAPASGRDLGAALVCPHCGGLDTETQLESVQCLACGCEFTTPAHSQAKAVVLRLSETERRRQQFLGVARSRRHTHAQHQTHERKHVFEQP